MDEAFLWILNALGAVTIFILGALLAAFFEVILKFYLLAHLPPKEALNSKLLHVLKSFSSVTDSIAALKNLKLSALKDTKPFIPFVDLTQDLEINYFTIHQESNVVVANPYVVKFDILKSCPKLFFTISRPGVLTVSIFFGFVALSLGTVIVVSSLASSLSTVPFVLMFLLGIALTTLAFVTIFAMLFVAFTMNLAPFAPVYLMIGSNKVIDLRARQYLRVQKEERSDFRVIVEEKLDISIPFKITSYTLSMVVGKARVPIYHVNSLLLMFVEHENLAETAKEISFCVREIWKRLESLRVPN